LYRASAAGKGRAAYAVADFLKAPQHSAQEILGYPMRVRRRAVCVNRAVLSPSSLNKERLWVIPSP